MDHQRLNGCTNVLPVKVLCCVCIDFCIMLFYQFAKGRITSIFLWHFCQYMPINTYFPCNVFTAAGESGDSADMIVQFLLEYSYCCLY